MVSLFSPTPGSSGAAINPIPPSISPERSISVRPGFTISHILPSRQPSRIQLHGLRGSHMTEPVRDERRDDEESQREPGEDLEEDVLRLEARQEPPADAEDARQRQRGVLVPLISVAVVAEAHGDAVGGNRDDAHPRPGVCERGEERGETGRGLRRVSISRALFAGGWTGN